MKTWYQIYREGYWYTSTTDHQEALEILESLIKQGFTGEIRIK